MRISDWSSDVCSSDLLHRLVTMLTQTPDQPLRDHCAQGGCQQERLHPHVAHAGNRANGIVGMHGRKHQMPGKRRLHRDFSRSEEHTSELQSLMRIPYAVFCLKKKKTVNSHESKP